MPQIYILLEQQQLLGYVKLGDNHFSSFSISQLGHVSPSITPPPNITSNSCVIILGIPTVNDNCSFTFSNDAPGSFQAVVYNYMDGR